MNFCKRIIPVLIVRSKNYNTLTSTNSHKIASTIVNSNSRTFFVCGTVYYSKYTMESQNISKEELKKRLTPLQYHITQEKGTERPFSGKFNKTYDKGMYSCIVCGQELFSSDTKYDSGCGWPAFNNVLDKGLVKLSKDTSNGTIRTEVQCAKCDAHLGHVFDDGPKPTGKRFCINSASIDFKPAASGGDN